MSVIISLFNSLRSSMSDDKDNEISSSVLSWLHGVWESEEAEVKYPTMETIQYYEIAEFKPVSPILIDYQAQMWHALNKTKMHTEKGFIKVQPDGGETIAMVVSHNFGLAEVSEGTVNGQALHLKSRFLSWMSFTKLTPTKQVVRDFVLKDDTLYQTVLMETIKTPLQEHLKVKYRRMK